MEGENILASAQILAPLKGVWGFRLVSGVELVLDMSKII